MPGSGVAHLSQEPWGATAGEELYYFGMLEISLQLQCGTWIIGVLEWMQREEAGATVVQVRVTVTQAEHTQREWHQET